MAVGVGRDRSPFAEGSRCRRMVFPLLAALLFALPPIADAQLPNPLDPEELTEVPGLGVWINGIRPNVPGTSFIQTGHALGGAGDFNGDGLADLVLGAPGTDTPTGPDRGEALLVLGTDSLGEGGEFNLADLDGSNGARFQGYESTLLAGRLSGVGDVNGDSLPDFLIGFFQVYTSEGGAAYLVYGSSTPLEAPGILSLADLDGRNGVRISADALSVSHFGREVRGAGDVNGDGLADFAIASFDDLIVLLYGNRSGLGKDGRLEVTASGGSDSVLITGALGASISGAGDVNGDGIDDLILSDTRSSLGLVFLIEGSLSGIGSAGLLDLHSAIGNGVVLLTGPSDSFFGVDLAGAGDLNGDGLDDLLIGAPGPSGDVGQVFVLFGNPTLFSGPSSIDLDALAPPQGLILHGIDPGDRIGLRVAGAGDVNGDGFADLLVTAEGADACYVVYGSPTGVAPELREDLSRLDGTNGVVVYPSPPFQELASVGDHNGDGISDLIVSWDTGGGSALPGEWPTGECYLFYGRTVAMSARYSTHIRAGDAPRKGIGVLSDGSHPEPFSRCRIDYGGGSGPGPDGSSLETVTLTRSAASVENLASPEAVARVVWAISTDRAGYGSARLTFHCVSSEIAGLEETDLRLFHAPSPSGPWTPALPMALSTRRNEITGTVAVLGSPEHFALAAPGGSLGVDTEAIIRALLGLDAEDEVLDVNGDHHVDVGDVAFNLNVSRP